MEMPFNLCRDSSKTDIRVSKFCRDFLGFDAWKCLTYPLFKYMSNCLTTELCNTWPVYHHSQLQPRVRRTASNYSKHMLMPGRSFSLFVLMNTLTSPCGLMLVVRNTLTGSSLGVSRVGVSWSKRSTAVG